MKILLRSLPVLLLLTAAVFAQKAPKGVTVVMLDARKVSVRGELFNEASFTGTDSNSLTRSYFRVDKVRKELVVTQVSLDFDEGKWVAQSVETFVCPFAEIDKTASYNLPMDFDGFGVDGKMFRLTLLSRGQGADTLHFKRINDRRDAEKPETSNVNNLTIGFAKSADAEKWLKTFTSF